MKQEDSVFWFLSFERLEVQRKVRTRRHQQLLRSKSSSLLLCTHATRGVGGAAHPFRRAGSHSTVGPKMRNRLFAIVTVAAAASIPTAEGGECGKPSKGPVLGGVDMVQIVRNGPHPVDPPPQGSSEFAVTNPIIAGNYTFWFQSAENAATFESSPSRYLPAYGGY